MLAFGPFLGRAVAKIGPKPIMTLGFILSAIGALALVEFNRSLYEMALLPTFLMVGNVGVLIAMSNTIVLSAKRAELGIQTGMNQTFRNLGSAIAPVLVTTILGSYLATYFETVSPAPGVSFQVAFRAYDLTGFQVVFALAAGLAVLGAVLSLAMRNFRYLADGTLAPATEPRGSPAPEPAIATTTAPRP